MNATAVIQDEIYPEKAGTADIDVDFWWELFGQREYEDRLEDEYLDFLAEQERQYIEDCRVDYGGI